MGLAENMLDQVEKMGTAPDWAVVIQEIAELGRVTALALLGTMIVLRLIEAGQDAFGVIGRPLLYCAAFAVAWSWLEVSPEEFKRGLTALIRADSFQ